MFSQRTFIFFLFLIVDPAGIRSVFSQHADEIELKKKEKTPKAPKTHKNGTRKFDWNPLHLLCYPCKFLVYLLGGLLGGLLGPNLIKQLGIFGCSYVLSLPLRFPFVPNLICVAVFDTIGIIAKKKAKGNGLCQVLFLCPKNKAPTHLVSEFAKLDHEDRMIAILESEDTANLSKEMENFNDYLFDNVAPKGISGTQYEIGLRHAIRNFVAAVSYQIDYLQQQQINKQ